MYGLKKRSKQDENGLIQGAGTGTSDDIKKNVPAGSYIMPADSTQQIGTNNLKNMGSPTPVNLSNGEFQLSPDQVHSVGVQTLDAMKNQTHMPVDQPQLGFKPGQNKPELFFANGGLVPSAYPSADDIRRAQQNRIGGPQMRDVSGITRDVNRPMPSTNVNNTASSTVTSNSTPSSSPANPAPTQGGGFGAGVRNFVNNSKLVKGTGYLGAASALFANAATPSEDYRERFGFGDQSPEDLGTVKGFAKDFGIRGLGYASDLGNALTFGQAGRFYADKQRIASEAKAAQPEFNNKQNKPNTVVNNPFGNNKTPPTTQTQPEAQTPSNSVQNSDPYAIQQKGNSFSYANPSAAAQARADGIREGEGLGFKVRPVNDPRGVANLFANTQEMGPTEQQIQNAIAQREMNLGLGMRGYGNNPVQAPQRNEAQEAERQAVIRAASTPIAGARGLTANQVRTLSDLQQGEDNRANQRYTTDANNVAALQREAMGQAGQNYRTELGEQGTNNRFNANLGFDAQKFQATNDLANREFNLNATEKGFGIRNSARLEKLYEQYDSAKSDEDRKSIQEKINRYAGRKESESSNPYITVKRGEILDEKGNTIQPAGEVLFNRITGQTIDPLAQMPQSTNIPNGMTRQVGTSNGKPVYEDAQGNRFIGN
ncbi:hypothetical protein NQU59_09390 [Acinetobacter colistiniresistens]|uniref:hypothetical protein n=1 Tax=Acinetobacter colistiniresistens TaxID=280145 RepID=UPI00211C1F49|nr:hypothetical protein [Acinetobacter colistiniresistens]UUM25968.1 hypothetical protein NQU59_09390 [Acinetobacter colistiniresistens]